MIKQIIIFLIVLIFLSFFIHSKIRVNEGFQTNHNSLSYLSNGTVTKLFGIQNFKLGDNDNEYLVFNGTNAFLKIPSINSNNFVLSFKMKSSLPDNYILFGTPFYLHLVDRKFRLESPLMDETLKIDIVITLDKPYNIELGIRGDSGYLSIDGEKSNFKFDKEVKTTDLILGKNTTSTQFFKGEIADIKLIKDKETGGSLLEKEKTPDKCNWTPVGVTRQECIDNCELFNGCEDKNDECTEKCSNCTDSGKCEWLENKCNYVASGTDYTSCVYKCVKNKNCNWESCVDKCSGCGMECPWIKVQTENIQQYYEPPKKDTGGAPGRPRIRVETSTGMVSIYWNAPDNGDAPIETYIFFLYKTFKKNEGVKIGLVPFSKCRNCFHVIENLDPNETYSIGIRAYNSHGGRGSLSEMSNIETFKPKLERITNDIGLISLETLSNNDAYMNNYHYCNN